jgi:hypothetical protein
MVQLVLKVRLRARTVPSLVDAAVTDRDTVAEAEMMLSVLARAVAVKAVLLMVVLVRVVDVVDDEVVVADVVVAVQAALALARQKLLLLASKSGNPRTLELAGFGILSRNCCSSKRFLSLSSGTDVRNF